MRRRRALAAWVILSNLVVAACALSCVLGDERDPGCQSDVDCDQGFVCRAGACFRYTTPESPPTDPAIDAGDGGDGAPG